MLRKISIGILSLVLTMGVGCAKSPEEKAKSQADDAIASLKTNANAVDAMGTPNGSWSEADLARYEGLLNALEADANKVQALDGKDGVIILGSWSLIDLRRIVNHNRGVLREAHVSRGRIQLADKHDRLRDEQATDFAGLQKMGELSAEWSRGKLLEYIATLEKIESRQYTLDSMKGELRMSKTPAEFWQHLSTLKGLAKDLLKEKPETIAAT